MFKWSKENDKEYQIQLNMVGFVRVIMDVEHSQKEDDLSDFEYQKNAAWLERLYEIRKGKISKKKKAIEGIKQNMLFKKLK